MDRRLRRGHANMDSCGYSVRAMTDLKKPVTRRAVILTDHRVRARDCDEVSVTLHPNGTIGFRAKRGRKEYTLPLATAYKLAIQAQAAADKAEKAKARRAKR